MHASIIFNAVFTLFAYFALLQRVFVSAAPTLIPHTRSRVEQIQRSTHHQARASSNPARFLAQPPRWVIYSDEEIDGGNTVIPSPSKLKGFNVFNLAFYVDNGPADQLANWKRLVDSDRAKAKQIVENLHAHKISLMFSVFGSTEAPTSKPNGKTEYDYASEIAKFAKAYMFDGVDVDYEDFDAFNNGKAIKWLKNFHSALRKDLGDDFLISAAPIDPWFTDNKDTYPHGSYLDVELNDPKAVDFYNLQLYNQDTMYSTCAHIVSKSQPGPYQHTSIKEIHDNGVALNKLLIGKPAIAGDAIPGGDQGYMSPSKLQGCFQSAFQLKDNDSGDNWQAGGMWWQYHSNSVGSLTSLVSSATGFLSNLLGGV